MNFFLKKTPLASMLLPKVGDIEIWDIKELLVWIFFLIGWRHELSLLIIFIILNPTKMLTLFISTALKEVILIGKIYLKSVKKKRWWWQCMMTGLSVAMTQKISFIHTKLKANISKENPFSKNVIWPLSVFRIGLVRKW